MEASVNNSGHRRRLTLSRRRFLAGAVATTAGLTLTDGLAAGWLPLSRPTTIRWMSPRASLDVMDDYPLWVARRLGYFDRHGVDVELLPGPQGTDTMLQALVDGGADVAFPSPSALAAAVDRGLPLVSAFSVFPRQVFSFAVPSLSPIVTASHLAGRTIAVGSLGWRQIIEPMLVDAGVDVRRARYVEGGPNWVTLLDRGRADAALTWEGLRAEWAAQGRMVRRINWDHWSRLPSNSYVVRRADLDSPERRDTLTRFFRAVVMGLEFGRHNPNAAAQITYQARPGLAAQVPPRRALAVMSQLAAGYEADARATGIWGLHDPVRWRRLAGAMAALGRDKPGAGAALYSNQLITPVNAVDRGRVRADALAFALDRDFK